MRRPSRVRDAVGGVLLVVVGLLYLSGISDVDAGRHADGDTVGTVHPGVMEVHVDVNG